MANLAEDETVYTVSDSMDPVGRMRAWQGERVDKIVVMGCAYDPGSLGDSFKLGYVRHRRAFAIADKVRPAYERWRPEVVLLSVDVRPWFPSATECFGFEPDRIIDEQSMKWQQVGYLVAHQLARTNRQERQQQFTFCGGAKNRQGKMIDYVRHLPVPAVIHGGGWEPHLGQMDHVRLEGFQPYWKSARLMLSSQYSLTLHEPVGEQAGWITARFFENLGCGLVNFTDADYDRDERVLPRNHPLRVSSGEELAEKIRSQPYEEWIGLQSSLVDPAWLDWRRWYMTRFVIGWAIDVQNFWVSCFGSDTGRSKEIRLTVLLAFSDCPWEPAPIPPKNTPIPPLVWRSSLAVTAMSK